MQSTTPRILCPLRRNRKQSLFPRVQASYSGYYGSKYQLPFLFVCTFRKARGITAQKVQLRRVDPYPLVVVFYVDFRAFTLTQVMNENANSSTNNIILPAQSAATVHVMNVEYKQRIANTTIRKKLPSARRAELLLQKSKLMAPIPPTNAQRSLCE